MTETIRQHPSVLRVQQALLDAGLTNPIIVMPDATHSAQAAADALKCDIAEIAKSIIFRAENGVAVLAWVVNDPEDMKVLIEWGVDGIYTSYPDRLLKILHRCSDSC